MFERTEQFVRETSKSPSAENFLDSLLDSASVAIDGKTVSGLGWPLKSLAELLRIGLLKIAEVNSLAAQTGSTYALSAE